MIRQVRYRTRIDGFTVADLGGFFAGWPRPPPPARRLEILAAASHVVLALDGGRLVGHATAISDRLLSAYIPLLEVLEPYRRRGIGSELVRRLLAEIGNLYMVDLVCDDALRPFYERLGFQALTGMALRRRDAPN